MIDLVLLQRFEAVCRLRSFSRAADEVGVSHSAMTKSIRLLEDLIDARLFDRSTRSVVPTDAGVRLAQRANDLLLLAEDVRTDVQVADRSLNIVCGPLVVDNVALRGMVGVRQAFPDVRVAIQAMAPGAALESLTRGLCQMLLFHGNIARELSHQRSLDVEEVFSEPYVVLFRPGHPAELTDLSLQALLGFDWVVAGYDPLFEAGVPRAQREALRTSGFARYRLPSQAACLEMAATTDVLTIAPASSVLTAPWAERLRSTPYGAPARFSVCAITRPGWKMSKPAEAFLKAIRMVRPTGVIG
jgi:LysR family transcriptional regulator, regulator of abg operon